MHKGNDDLNITSVGRLDATSLDYKAKKGSFTSQQREEALQPLTASS